MTKSIKNYVTCSLAALYSFSATAGTLFDSYQSSNYASARKIVTVERESGAQENLVISTLCRDEDKGPFERCDPPMVVSENTLRIIAIQEAYEQLRIFNPKSTTQNSSIVGQDVRDITVQVTFLIPGLAPFISLGPGVAVGYLGLWLVSVLKSVNEGTTKKTVATKTLDQILLSGTAGLVLKAVDQTGVAMSRSDRADAIPGLYTRLGVLAEQQQQQLDKVYAKTHQLGLPSRQDVLAKAQKFMGWAQAYRKELNKLAPQQVAGFNGMVQELLYTHQQALCVSAVNMTTQMNALLERPSLTMTEQSQILRDYAYLTMLAGE